MRILTRLAVVVDEAGLLHRALARQRRAAAIDGMIGIGRRRAPERHHGIADEFVDGAVLVLDLRRDAVEIARQQRNDAVAEPLRHAGEAGEIDEHHAHRPHRAAEARTVAVADQPLHQIGRNVFPERGEPLRHVADGAGKILDLGQPRRMPLHLVEIEALDMPDLVHHLDQGRRDQALGEPCRQQPGEDDQDRKTDQQIPDRHLHRSEKFRLRHHRHQRPARKRNRRQHRLIGLAVPRHLGVERLALRRACRRWRSGSHPPRPETADDRFSAPSPRWRSDRARRPPCRSARG